MEDSLPSRILAIVEKYQIPLILGLLGIVLIGVGFLAPRLSQAPKKDIVVTTSKDSNSTAKKIVVDIAGGVKNPGVYDVKDGDRISDALAAAGGLSDQADNNWVSKNINLASKVTDGQKIYISTLADSQTSPSTQTLGASQGVVGKININKASEKELDSLPSIGQVTADKIIAGRPYQKIEELLSRKIVGSSTYSKIKDKVSVY